MNQLEVILSYTSSIIIFVVSLVTFFRKLINQGKILRKMNDSKLLDLELERLMMLAEQVSKDGKTKEAFVLDRVKHYANKLKIDFNYDDIISKITSLIQLTKIINYNIPNNTLDDENLTHNSAVFNIKDSNQSPFRTYINKEKEIK